MVPEIWCAPTDQWMDGWKKWHIEVGAPPKKEKHLTQLTLCARESLWSLLTALTATWEDQNLLGQLFPLVEQF